ncbi:MAG TPA: hypothetical protein VEV17_19285 [Bryobacteraceae bacterium]|nr:hypothetical protein [Bryobacteraceae bacterium]
MHSARTAAFLLGAWIMGSLFMIFVATQNFATADRLASSGNETARALLRAMAGQENQLFFVNWERAQLLLALALTGFLLFGMATRLLASLSGVLVILGAYQHFQVTPQMIALTAQLNAAAPANQFARLHAIYGVLEVVKLLIALALALLVLPRWRRRAPAQIDVQPVDYAHHGHVDG